MSKEELLKYLIAEIDLIMHDKDYRFENANGTWYSRESCRDLTNEEVFEELRTELRQFADLEAKLAESEKKAYSRGHSQRDIANEIKLNALREDVANKEKRIVELKQQLAESEKQIKDAREAGNMAVDSWCKNRRKYEAQIAEMQNKSFILYSMLYETLEKQGCDNVASQIDQMTGWTYDKETDWLKGNRNYDQLKQQLADKDKEIETILKENEELVIKHNVYNWGDKIQKDKVYSLTGEALELLINRQNQKAIEQLEQIINLFEPYENEEKDTILCANNGISFLEYIDNQIEELTHQHEYKGE